MSSDALDEIGLLHLAGRIADRRQQWQVDHPGVICEHCGQQQRGSASVGLEFIGEHGRSGSTVKSYPVCHAEAPYPDCYRLVTVYGETLGARSPNREESADV